MKRFMARISTIAALVLLACLPARAQTDVMTGSIQGLVLGQDGNSVPGVSVQAVNRDTGFRRADSADRQGRYKLSLLPPGTYSVRAELEGFETVDRRGIVVLLGSTATIDFEMKVAKVKEQVVVSGEAPLIDVTRTSTAANVDEQALKSLPLNGRRFTDLAQLTPQAVKNTDRVDVGGQRGIQNSFNIDGASAQSTFFGEQVGGFGPPYFFSAEAIQEFQVVSSSYQAQYGNATGGVINAITKSGTNELHGSGFFYYRNQALMERDANGKLPTQFEAKQFGATLGGPILADHLHFFVAYDGQRRTNPAESEPADSTPDKALSNPVNQQFLLDHGYDINADSGVIQIGNNVDVPLVKLDAQLSSGSEITLRDNYLRWEAPNGTGTGFRNGLSNAATDNATSNSLVGTLTSVLAADTTNELTVQGLYENRPRIPNTTNIPQVSINNGSDWTFGQLFFAPSGLADRRWQVLDNFSRALGNHALKAGIDYSHSSYIDPFLRNQGGVYAYNNWDDFFAGKPASYQQGFSSTGGRVKYSQSMFSAYAQDEWRYCARLTLNAGVRYEYQKQPDTGNVNPLYPQTAHVPSDKNNWMGRVGFAWDILGDHRTLVRGGGGIFYTPTPSIIPANVLLNDGFSNVNYVFVNPAFAWPTRLDARPGGASPSKPSIQVIDPNFVNTKVYRYTLGIEREIIPDFAVGVEATYAKSFDLERGSDSNLTVVGIGEDGRPRYGTFDANGRVTPKRPDANFNQIFSYESDAEGKYHSFSFNFRGRISPWWRVQGFYTFAAARDSSSNERSTSIGGSAAEDIHNVKADYGYADSNVRHNFLIASTESLPLGIKFAQIFNVHSGLPYSVLAGYDANADGITGNDRADASFDPATGQPTGKHFGRNTRTQPAFRTLDVTLSKTFRLLHVVDATIIFEAFNLLHSSDRIVPLSNENYYVVSKGKVVGYNPKFGKATQASFAAARQFQIGANISF